MKKTKIALICTLIIAFTCVLLAGCSKTEQISSIGLKDTAPDAALELQIGKLDYSKYTLLVNYESGSVEEVPLTADMISELDQLKLYQAGDHVITVSYGGKTCEVRIAVKRNRFGALKFSENTVFTYDGKEHKVEIEGELPANATVSYVGGNSFVNAGSYDVTAVVACEGYVTERITTTVNIQRAKYDMSNVVFAPKEVVYNGKAHAVEISGTLPTGVSAPTYYINGNKTSSAIDAGEYTVTAVFANNNPNYEMIPNMVAKLKITPADYSIDGVTLVFKNEDGSALSAPSKKYDGKGVIFELKDNGALKNKVSVSYAVRNEEGAVISVSNTKTNIENAGKYTVVVDFSLLDNKNYNPIEPMVCIFEITKAEMDTTGLFFDPKIVEYDGELHSLGVTLPISMLASKISISYEYFRLGEDGVLQEGGKNVTGVREAGEYTVKAVFTVNDPNYEQLPDMQARLVIEKKQLPVAQFGFYNTDQTYTGERLLPTVAFVGADYISIGDVTVYQLNGDSYVAVDAAIAAGTYLCKVTVSITDTANCVFDNGACSIELECAFTVREKKIDVAALGFKNDNVALVSKGEQGIFTFETKGINGISFTVSFLAVNDTVLSTVVEATAVAPDASGVIYATFDTSAFAAGEYICMITVTADGTNHVLSDGDRTMAYYFTFNVVG